MLHAHETVLKQQAVDALCVKPDGLYVDGTFGRGGHSRLVLNKLSAIGHLFVVDCDPQAIAEANKLAVEDKRVTVCQGHFEDVKCMLGVNDESIDGFLFDFGVSSPQIDQPHRGFSFQSDGPLDMRMDSSKGETAADWLMHASYEEMKQVFWRYGEEKNSGRIAHKIVQQRAIKPIARTSELVDLIETVNYRGKTGKNPSTRVFQAIRIHINRELEQIKSVLPDVVDMLRSKGRLVIISFHSLEDRIVKQFMKKQSRSAQANRRMPIAVEENSPVLRVVGKPIKAIDVDSNVRARSAIMRVAEKV